MKVRSTGSLGGQIHTYNITVSLLLMLFFLLQVPLPGFSRLQVVYHLSQYLLLKNPHINGPLQFKPLKTVQE